MTRTRRLIRLLGLAALVACLQVPPALSQSDAPTLSFALADPSGKILRPADFPGRWLLIYFGYTHCADQCPTTLGDMAEALSVLGPMAARVQPLFITIDPARDAGPDLADYTSSFDPRLIGLAGSEEETERIAAAFGVQYSKIPLPGGSYVIDHSGALYLVDPQAHLAARFGHMSDPYMIETKLLELLAEKPPA